MLLGVRAKPKRVLWRARALADLREFHDWIASLDRGEPKKTIGRIRAASDVVDILAVYHAAQER